LKLSTINLKKYIDHVDDDISIKSIFSEESLEKKRKRKIRLILKEELKEKERKERRDLEKNHKKKTD
jgi:hypothetical protein